MSDAYQEFLARKRLVDPMTGLSVLDAIPDYFKPHQADITRWALRRGRAAIFAGTGLGKTLMELEWSRQIVKATGKPVLLLAPLAVSAQHVREGDRFGIQATIVRSQSDVRDGTSVTNYQKLPHFDISEFGGVGLDESSILKSQDGHYRTTLIEQCAQIPFRLAATATPAPNDYMELGNHAEFLGVMSYTDMIAAFFTHDGGETQKWRLKGHAEDAFWKWMASWSVMLRKPSDLGYDDAGYDIPPLREVQHTVGVPYQPNMDTGLLFPMEAQGLGERIKARRGSVDSRIECAFGIVLADWCAKLAAWHGNRNTRQIENGNIGSIRKSESDAVNNVDQVKKTSNTCEHILPQTQTKKSSPQPREIEDCGQNMGLTAQSSTPCLPNKEVNARSAGCHQKIRGESVCTSTIATNQNGFEAYSASIAIGQSVTLETIPNECLEPWLIWCNLNNEQDALEKRFGNRCFSVRGSDEDVEKERRIIAWLNGDRPVMLTKTSIMGFGLNLQFCRNIIFVGASDSFEQTYQAIRRCWRFGQTKTVNVHFIAIELEGAVVANYRRKEQDAERMAAALVHHMADLSSQSVRGLVREIPNYFPTQPMVIPSWLGEAA